MMAKASQQEMTVQSLYNTPCYYTDLDISYFSTKTYVVGTQKNRLIEMVLLRTQNIFKTDG